MKTFIHTQSDLINQISTKLARKNETLSIAESCTGGFLSSCFTSFSGASKFFIGSVVAYDILMKISMLKIDENKIKKFGVVSEEIVVLMAKNIRKLNKSSWGVATTGYADLIPGKKKSHAWIAVSCSNYTYSKCIYFDKKREENIQLIALEVLKILRKEL